MDHDKLQMTSETEKKEKSSSNENAGKMISGEECAGSNSEENDVTRSLQPFFVADTLEDDESIIPPSQDDSGFLIPSTPAYESEKRSENVDLNESTISILEETCILDNKAQCKDSSREEAATPACNENDMTQDLAELEATQPIIPSNLRIEHSFTTESNNTNENKVVEDEDDEWQLKFSETQTQEALTNYKKNDEIDEEPETQKILPVKDDKPEKEEEEDDDDDLPATLSIEVPPREDDVQGDYFNKVKEPEINEVLETQSDDEIEPSQSCLSEYKGETISSSFKVPSIVETPNEEIPKLCSEKEKENEVSNKSDMDITMIDESEKRTIELSDSEPKNTFNDIKCDSLSVQEMHDENLKKTMGDSISMIDEKRTKDSEFDMESVEKKSVECNIFKETTAKVSDEINPEMIDTNGNQIEEIGLIDDIIDADVENNKIKPSTDIEKMGTETKMLETSATDFISNSEEHNVEIQKGSDNSDKEKSVNSVETLTNKVEHNVEVIDIDEEEKEQTVPKPDEDDQIELIAMLSVSKEIETSKQDSVENIKIQESDVQPHGDVSKTTDSDSFKSTEIVVDSEPTKMSSDAFQTSSEEKTSSKSFAKPSVPLQNVGFLRKQKAQTPSPIPDTSYGRRIASVTDTESLDKIFKSMLMTVDHERLDSFLSKPNEEFEFRAVFRIRNQELFASLYPLERHTAFNPAVLDEVDSNGDIIRTWCSPGVLIKALLSLAHGNADCERGFSENKNILESRSNLGAASINGIRRIKSELKKCGSIKNFNINPKLLSSVMTSWRRYENRTKAEKNIEKKEKEKISADNNLLQLKSEEQQLKKRLESTQILLKKAELSITDGLKHKSFTDVECGQVLLKDCNKKTSEIMILLEKNRKAQSEYSNVNPEKRKRRSERIRRSNGASPIYSSSTATSSTISSKISSLHSGEMADLSSFSGDAFPKTSTQKSPQKAGGLLQTFGGKDLGETLKSGIDASPVEVLPNTKKKAAPKRKRGGKKNAESSSSDAAHDTKPKNKRAKGKSKPKVKIAEDETDETEESKDAVPDEKPKKPTRRKKEAILDIMPEEIKLAMAMIPTSTEDDSSSFQEDANFGTILPGCKVMARWTDRCYYSGMVQSQEPDGKWSVLFEDKVSHTVSPECLIKIAILPKGTSVMVLSPDDGCFDPGIIRGHFREGNKVGYEVELDNGVTKRYARSAVSLTSDQAKLVMKNAPPTTPTSITINLDNIIDGKRKRKSIQSPVPVTPPVKRSSRVTRSKKPDSNLDSTSDSGVSDDKNKSSIKDSKDEEPPKKKVKKGASSLASVETTSDISEASTSAGTSSTKPTASTSSASTSKTPKVLPGRSAKKLFKDYAFLLTNADRKQVDVSSDSDTSKKEENDIVPFDKEDLYTHINSGGGIILEKFDDHKKCTRKHIYLLANSYLRTMKYIQCIAAGIRCIKHHWVQNCLLMSKILCINSYILPAGYSILSEQVIEWHGKTDVFSNCKIALVSVSESPFVHAWSSVLSTAKADFVQKWNPATSGSSSVVDVLITDKECPSDIIQSAKKRKIPIVSSEWIIQCLIEGKKLPYDAHPKFKYTFFKEQKNA